MDESSGLAISGLSAPERAPEIVRVVESRRRIAVSELAKLFGVSQVTMRQDLHALAQQALLVRIHGAAMAVTRSGGELDFQVRLQKERQEKLAIARVSAALVGDGEVVALDASTTAYYVALALKERRELVVVTNSLRIGSALLDAPQIRVVLTGGELRRTANSMVGELGQHVLAKTKIGKGFFGCQGLSLEDGLMDLDPEEVRLKMAMVAACAEPIGILDYTKWRRGGLLSFASAAQISALITDSKAPNDGVAGWEARGVDVVRAQIASDGARRPAARRQGRTV
jgi:DeoR/GlpR family transcriptional regulator of sugar metabolism